tara:strand:+ start:219 stop:578 length:360 start_codon:yes stop_codon:yes gene_type:complete
MNTKEELVTNIKQWLQLENEIKLLQKELKTRKDKRKEISSLLVNVMKENEIDCFDVSEGKILYTKNKTKSSISKQFLMDTLKQYFPEDSNIDPDEVGQFILDNRKIDIKENLRHKPNKK